MSATMPYPTCLAETIGSPVATVDLSSASRPANTAPAGTSTFVALMPAQTEATQVGLVGVAVTGLTSTYRTCPATGATNPNTGLTVTFPVKLILLVRSWRVGFLVVRVVPRASSSGVPALDPLVAQPVARAATP